MVSGLSLGSLWKRRTPYRARRVGILKSYGRILVSSWIFRYLSLISNYGLLGSQYGRWRCFVVSGLSLGLLWKRMTPYRARRVGILKSYGRILVSSWIFRYLSLISKYGLLGSQYGPVEVFRGVWTLPGVTLEAKDLIPCPESRHSKKLRTNLGE